MTLMWLRLYLTTEALGALFDVDKSTVSRNGRRVLAVLRQISQEELAWPDPPRRGQGKDLAQVLEAHPDLFAILDATEQPVQRPQARTATTLLFRQEETPYHQDRGNRKRSGGNPRRDRPHPWLRP